MAYIHKLLLYLSYLLFIQFMYVGSSSDLSHADRTAPPDCTFECSDSRCFRQLFECLSDSFRRDVSRLTLAIMSQLLQCTTQLEKMNTQLNSLVNVTSEHLSAMVHSLKAEVAAIDESAKATQLKVDRVKQLLSSRSVDDSVSAGSHHTRHHHGEVLIGSHPDPFVNHGSHHQHHGRFDEDSRPPHLVQRVPATSDHSSLHHLGHSVVHSDIDSSGQSLDLNANTNFNTPYSVNYQIVPYPKYVIRTLDPESSHIVKCFLCDGSERQYLIRTHNRWKRAVAPDRR